MVLSGKQLPDLNDVAVFVRVGEAASFTAAARALGLPRASVSKVVARLEAALGAQLLYRTTRKVELTEIGRRFWETASRGLGLIDEAGEALAAAQSEPSGLLRIVAPINFSTMALIPWLPEFFIRHPAVRIALRLTDAAPNLLEAHADLAVVTGRQADSSHITRRLDSTPLILVASPAYLQRKPAPRRLAEAASHDFVLFSSDADTERWALNGPDGPVELEVKGRINVSGPHAELSAALAGLGIALLPEAPIRPYLDSGALVRVLPQYRRDGGSISVIFPASRHQPAALRAFLDFLTAKTAEQSAPPAVGKRAAAAKSATLPGGYKLPNGR